MKILVSACLFGENCKYNGGNNLNAAVLKFVEGHEVVPICPEMMAGMGCPRTPVEIVKGIVTDRNGNVVDGIIRNAVARALEQIKGQEIDCAVLQSRSPTCGVNQIYDGTFTRTLIPGMGVTAKLLAESGLQVFGESQWEALL